MPHFLNFSVPPPFCYSLKLTNYGMRKKKVSCKYGCFSGQVENSGTSETSENFSDFFSSDFSILVPYSKSKTRKKKTRKKISDVSEFSICHFLDFLMKSPRLEFIDWVFSRFACSLVFLSYFVWIWLDWLGLEWSALFCVDKIVEKNNNNKCIIQVLAYINRYV